MQNKLNIFPEFNPETPVYFIDGFNKISIGNIIGFQADSVVLDQDKNVLKVERGFFHVKKINKNFSSTEQVSVQKIFTNLEATIKSLTDSEEIFLKIKTEFLSKTDTELHRENHYNPVDTFDEYQKIAMSTKAYGKGLPVFYLALKLNGEAGEVAEKVGKAWRDKDGKFDELYVLEIKKELGDILWYICALADDLKINLADVANGNIAKILDRRNRGVVSGDGDNR